MNPFTRLGRIVAAALTLVVVAPLNNLASGDFANAAPTTSSARPSNRTGPTISGTARASFTLTLARGTWLNSPTSWAYQWYRCTTKPAAAATVAASCSLIAGATTTTFVVGSDDVGKYLVASVRASNRDGSATRVTAGTAAVLAQFLPPKNTVAPTISGNKTVSQVLTVANGTWSETPTSYSYKWFRCTATKAAADALPTGCTEISGATASTYTLVTADAAKFVVASVTATNATGSTTKWSASTTVVAALARPANTVAPVVTGTATNSLTLTASTGTWTNYPTLTYQWVRCNARVSAAANSLPAGCSNIAGATSSTYVLTDSDVAKFVGVAVTGTNAIGAASKWSATTATAVAALPAPANTATPVVTGSAQVSRVLTLSNGTWNFRPTSFTYKWYSCTATKAAAATLPTGCTEIAGATSSTYQLLPAQSAKFVLGSVTATNSRGSTSRFTATTVAVTTPAPYSPVPFLDPSVGADSDVLVIGDSIEADVGVWLGYPIAAVTISGWYRCSQEVIALESDVPAFCSPITNPSTLGENELVIQQSDMGKFLTFKLIVGNSVDEVNVIAPTSDRVSSTPVNTQPPLLSGSQMFGQRLSISTGVWVGMPGDLVNFSYKWWRCTNPSPMMISGMPEGCDAITGATSSSYYSQLDDIGKYVVGTVQATGTLGGVGSSSSLGPQILSKPMLSLRLDGDPVVGNSLTAGINVASYPESTTTVSWYRCRIKVTTTLDAAGCVLIPGQISASYLQTIEDQGRVVHVKVTATNELGSSESVKTLDPSSRVWGPITFVVDPYYRYPPRVGYDLAGFVGYSIKEVPYGAADYSHTTYFLCDVEVEWYPFIGAPGDPNGCQQTSVRYLVGPDRGKYIVARVYLSNPYFEVYRNLPPLGPITN